MASVEEESNSLVNVTFGTNSATKLLEFKDLHQSEEKGVMAEESDDKYSCIARLDDELEEEKWEERTSVITKTDHEEYIAAAGAILSELIADVKTPVKR